MPPNSSEAAALHSFYLQYEQSSEAADRVWMEDAIQEKCMLMFPQERKYAFFKPLGIVNVIA
jgi:acyl-coenzyme A thioesterase 9